MPKAQAWRSSQGKKLLEYDIRKGRVTRMMDLEAVYNMHRAEFEICGSSPAEAFCLFEGRLEAAFKRRAENTSRSAAENAAFQQDRLTHPRPATNFRGSPQWEGSAAQRLMKQDITAGLHLGKTPTEFRMTRPEYQQFLVVEIGGHLKQEIKLRKWKENYPGRIKSIPPKHS